MNELTKNIAKLAATVTTVAGIGWGIVSFYPSDGQLVVQTSEADIIDLSFSKLSPSQKLGRSLDRMGHEPPRVYDFNGNKVMFSTATFPGKQPDQVMREYQSIFTEEDINSRVYTKPIYQLARMGTPGAAAEIHAIEEASMKGEIVPQLLSDKGFTMGGVTMDLDPGSNPDALMQERRIRAEKSVDMFGSAYDACGGDPKILAAMEKQKSPSVIAEMNAKVDKGAKASQEASCGGEDGAICTETRVAYREASDKLEALQDAVEAQPHLRSCTFMKNAARHSFEDSKDQFTDKIRGFASVEGFYNKKRNITHVTATWSDESFDARKANPARFGALDESETRSKLPLCDGCLRAMDFAGNGSEADYGATQVISERSPRIVAQEYIEMLVADGWDVADSSLAVNEVMRLSGKRASNEQWFRVRRGKHEFMTVRVRPLPGGGTSVSATATN